MSWILDQKYKNCYHIKNSNDYTIGTVEFGERSGRWHVTFYNHHPFDDSFVTEDTAYGYVKGIERCNAVDWGSYD